MGGKELYDVHQCHSQRGVAGGDGKLGCLCGNAGTSNLCDGSAHSSGCVVHGSNAMAAFSYSTQQQFYAGWLRKVKTA